MSDFAFRRGATMRYAPYITVSLLSATIFARPQLDTSVLNGLPGCAVSDSDPHGICQSHSNLSSHSKMAQPQPWDLLVVL